MSEIAEMQEQLKRSEEAESSLESEIAEMQAQLKRAEEAEGSPTSR